MSTRLCVLSFILLVTVSDDAITAERNARANTTATDIGRAVRFLYRPSQTGDRATQHVQFTLDLNTKIEQAGQVVSTEQRKIKRDQRRRLEVLNSAEHGPATAAVTYDLAEQTVVEPGGSSETMRQPVMGKTYIVRREGEELVITDEAGRVPAPDELQIVAANMETLGRPNPIGLFLHQRTIAPGERLQLPADLAADLIGFRGAPSVGDVRDFRMTLVGTATEDSKRCAVFEVRLDAASREGSNLNMRIAGRLLIEIVTCRAVSAHLSGPVSLTETHGPNDAAYSLSGQGNLAVAMRATDQR
jgi:hypothetical protein